MVDQSLEQVDEWLLICSPCRLDMNSRMCTLHICVAARTRVLIMETGNGRRFSLSFGWCVNEQKTLKAYLAANPTPGVSAHDPSGHSNGDADVAITTIKANIRM